MNIDESLTAKGFTPAASVPQVYGGPRVVDGIIIHHWGATGQTHGGVVNFFVNGPGNTSAHFVSSGAGGTHCLVNPDDAAWHAGNAEGNRTKIGIECRPEADESDYREVANLIAWLRQTFNLPLPLSPHRDWQATACPGKWDLAKLDAMAKGGSIAPQSAPAAPAPAAGQIIRSDDEIHWVVDPGDTLSKIAAYYNGPSVDQIAAYNRIDKNTLKPGQKIWIPGPLVWIIEAPDTIRSIAAYYGLDAGYLASINGLPGPDAEIYIGNTLIVKGA